MVRLKVNNATPSRERCYISIPYGAIKSNIFLFNITQSSIFQFLMVRLKENVNRFAYGDATKFQFLMVRLKAIPYRQEEVWDSISIPYGAIKRRIRVELTL